jgi:hypothetical protein
LDFGPIMRPFLETLLLISENHANQIEVWAFLRNEPTIKHFSHKGRDYIGIGNNEI